MSQIPFVTSETDLAAYLIISGFELIKIQYEPRSNGRQRGIFIFENSEKLTDIRNLFDSHQASMNLAEFTKTKNNLLDRVMGGLQ